MMAEYINRKELYMKMIQEYDEVEDLLGTIADVPTIDIVRCSECIHWDQNIKKYKPNEPLVWICKGKDAWGFCSSGERKE